MKKKRNIQRANQKAGKSIHRQMTKLQREVRLLSHKKKILDDRIANIASVANIKSAMEAQAPLKYIVTDQHGVDHKMETTNASDGPK